MGSTTNPMETTQPASAPKTKASGRRRKWPRFLARTRTFWRRLLTLLGPIVFTGLLIAAAAVYSERLGYELGVITAASFLGFGTTVIFSSAVLGERITLGTWEIALWMIYLNMATAFLYSWNLDLLEKLPWVGPYLRRARKNATTMLDDHKWIRRTAAFGVGLFVLSPLPGSGQLGGCFVGRIIGLHRRTTFLVVTLSGTIVAVGYALFGAYIGDVLDDNEVKTWIRVVGAIVFLAMGWLMFKMLRYLGREDFPSGAGAKADAVARADAVAKAEPKGEAEGEGEGEADEASGRPVATEEPAPPAP